MNAQEVIAALRRRSALPVPAQGGMLAVAGAAAVTSFQGLRGLASRAGTPPEIAFLLPVAVDAAAAVATLVWLTAEDLAVRAEARRLAWTAIVLSVIGNGADHALAVLGYIPPVYVVVVTAALVGGVAPAIFGATVHLAVHAGRRTAPPPAPKRVVTLTLRQQVGETPPPDQEAGVPNGTPEPRKLRTVPPRRSRAQLEAAGKALPPPYTVTRLPGELVEDLRARVEKAEREAARVSS